ncbi:hypothetical protein GGR57DRAFT_504236 [Xylariaceae sp. FL1272]|nr:hypothetical protein GGR57DRAFT_504236 [Xylariaceae sp. FL1272]
MPTQHVSSYRLRKDKLVEYLEAQFPKETISVTVGHDTFDFELAKDLTEAHHNAIDDLREKRED